MTSEQKIDLSTLASLVFEEYTKGVKDSFYSNYNYILDLSIVSWFDFFLTFVASFFLLYKAITYLKKEAEYQKLKKKRHYE